MKKKSERMKHKRLNLAMPGGTHLDLTPEEPHNHTTMSIVVMRKVMPTMDRLRDIAEVMVLAILTVGVAADILLSEVTQEAQPTPVKEIPLRFRRIIHLDTGEETQAVTEEGIPVVVAEAILEGIPVVAEEETLEGEETLVEAEEVEILSEVAITMEMEAIASEEEIPLVEAIPSEASLGCQEFQY
jgi:hypothetical protein